MKIATLGCSHSSDYAGDSWPIFLSKELNAELFQAYSAGAGNEMNIEKLKYILEEEKPDLVIVQLTDPVRLVLGLDKNVVRSQINLNNRPEFGHPNHFNGSYYYTFNAWENDKNLSKLFNHKVEADNFILGGVLTSDYNLYHKVIHTMAAMAFIAQAKNIPIVFFSWSVDVQSIINYQEYADIFKNVNIIPGFVEQFISKNSLIPVPPGQPGEGHHGPANQERIAKEFVLPFLKLTHGQLCTSR